MRGSFYAFIVFADFSRSCTYRIIIEYYSIFYTFVHRPIVAVQNFILTCRTRHRNDKINTPDRTNYRTTQLHNSMHGNSLVLTSFPACNNLRLIEGTKGGASTILFDGFVQLDTANQNVARGRQRRVIQAIFLPDDLGDERLDPPQRLLTIQTKHQLTTQSRNHPRPPTENLRAR